MQLKRTVTACRGRLYRLRLQDGGVRQARCVTWSAEEENMATQLRHQRLTLNQIQALLPHKTYRGIQFILATLRERQTSK